MRDAAKSHMIPTFAVPFMEQYANRSWFFDRPLVPVNRAGLLPEYQYTSYTTELMKALSRVVGTLPPAGEMNTFSPAKAENLIRNWTGGLGMYALDAVDFLGRKTGALPAPANPAKTLADIPFVRAFVARHPSMNAESIQRFYDSYDEASRYLKTINALKGDIRGYQDAANLLSYSTCQAMEGPRQAIGNITKMIDAVHKDPAATPDEKRQIIDKLYFDAIQSAKFGNRVFETLREDTKKWKERAKQEQAR
jgi:hypothetical protein